MLNCDFCGKPQNKIKRIIAGPHGVAICNECVFICTEILLNEISEFKEISFENKTEIVEEVTK